MESLRRETQPETEEGQEKERGSKRKRDRGKEGKSVKQEARRVGRMDKPARLLCSCGDEKDELSSFFLKRKKEIKKESGKLRETKSSDKDERQGKTKQQKKREMTHWDEQLVFLWLCI